MSLCQTFVKDSAFRCRNGSCGTCRPSPAFGQEPPTCLSTPPNGSGIIFKQYIDPLSAGILLLT